MIEKFIEESHHDKEVELYFGGGASKRLRGKVVGSADGVLILEYKGRRDYINAHRILAAWEI
jgi:hemerythrin-like domain-containing protein